MAWCTHRQAREVAAEGALTAAAAPVAVLIMWHWLSKGLGASEEEEYIEAALASAADLLPYVLLDDL